MVYAKIDWYTVLLYNTSFEEVLKRLNCFADCCDEILNSGYQRSVGYRTDVVYTSNGVSLSVNFDDMVSVEEEHIFFTKWSELRLDISGQGLDYLRALNDDIDSSLCDINFWGGEGFFKITRCDFAFDFVNYYGSFLDEFIYKLQDLERAYKIQRGNDGNTYLGCQGAGRNTAYNMKTGSNVKCLYLGTTRSDKLVRIYDKKLEQTKNGVFIKPIPKYFKENGDGEVKSWFRIEFQTRRKFAHKYLYGCGGDLKVVLRELFDIYQCKDPETKDTFEFIKKLYDWDKLPKIIENLHFTELPKKVLDKAHDTLSRYARSLFLVYAKYGVNGIMKILYNYLEKCNNPITLQQMNANIALRHDIVRLYEEEGYGHIYHFKIENDEIELTGWDFFDLNDPY